jgi:hypothetical protein
VPTASDSVPRPRRRYPGTESRGKNLQPGIPQPSGRHRPVQPSVGKNHGNDRGQRDERTQTDAQNRQVAVNYSAGVRTFLANEGYDPKFGARPLARLIQTRIKDRITDEILFGKLEKGGKITIGLKKDRADVPFQELNAPFPTVTPAGIPAGMAGPVRRAAVHRRGSFLRKTAAGVSERYFSLVFRKRTHAVVVPGSPPGAVSITDNHFQEPAQKIKKNLFQITCDQAFEQTIQACARPRKKPG